MYTGGTGADDGRHAIHGQQYEMWHDSDDDSDDDDDDNDDDMMMMVLRDNRLQPDTATGLDKQGNSMI